MPTETKWTLPTADGKTIYGLKNMADKPAEAAVFMVHGLTGFMQEYAFKRAADVLSAQGYDVYRFNLYDGWDNARSIMDCTLETHAGDLNTVIKAFGAKYKKAFAIGHSFGGPTIMIANPEGLTAASLWDPSIILDSLFDDVTPVDDQTYRLDWGVVYLVGKAMIDHANGLQEKECRKLAEDFHAPVQVIHAAEGILIKKPLSYHDHGKPENLPKNRHDVIDGTMHCFYEGDTCEELLAKTHAFFQSFH